MRPGGEHTIDLKNTPSPQENNDTPTEKEVVDTTYAEKQDGLSWEQAVAQLETEIGEQIKPAHLDQLKKTFELTQNMDSMRKNLNRLRDADATMPDGGVKYGRPNEADSAEAAPSKAELKIVPKPKEAASETEAEITPDTIRGLIDIGTLENELKTIYKLTSDEVDKTISQACDKLPAIFKKKQEKPNAKLVRQMIIDAIERRKRKMEKAA